MATRPKGLTGQYKYFVNRDYMVGGAKINLYAVERDILIPRFREPRIHFAIVCASRSCPKLRSWAFITEKIEEQLDDSARLFINDPTRNLFDREHKIAYLVKNLRLVHRRLCVSFRILDKICGSVR